MSGTSVEGSFKDCGPGKLPQLDFGCSGPSCNALLQLPGGSAVDNGNGMEYTSKAQCDSDATNYLSQFIFTQPQPQVDSHVSQDQNITLPDCKGLRVQSDGTSAGTHVDSTSRTSGPDCANPQPPSVSSVAVPPPQQSSKPGVVASSAKPLQGPSSIQVVNGPSSTKVAGTPVNPASNPTSSQPAQFTGTSAHHQHPKTGVLLLLLFVLGFFIQGTSAQQLGHDVVPDIEQRDTYELRIRQLSANLHTFGTQLGGYIATKVNGANGNGQAFANDLISDTVSTICQNFFSGGAPQAFSPVVVDNCVKAVYDDSSALDAELEFLAVFSASMFCNYLTSQAYPIANQFSSDACQGLQDLVVKPSAAPSSVQSRGSSVAPSVPPPSTPVPPPASTPPAPPPSNPPTTTQRFANTTSISAPAPPPTSSSACSSATQARCGGSCVDLTTDPNNCGKCGIVCASGKCANGACSSNSCTGQTCETFTTCGPGGSCVCASIVDNTGFCVSGTTACAGLATCGTSADCPLGAVCAVGTCCSTNVCIVADTCGGFSNTTTEASLLVRGWGGDTIARRATWV